MTIVKVYMHIIIQLSPNPHLLLTMVVPAMQDGFRAYPTVVQLLSQVMEGVAAVIVYI